MNNLVPSLKYAWLTVKHKYYVFRAGLTTGASIWRLVTHDMSKFGPRELPHYGRQFFGDKSRPEEFDAAWLHHHNVNDHHWEYWIKRTTHDRLANTELCLPMSDEAVKEMVADWIGASWAYTGRRPRLITDWPWFKGNWHKIRKRMNHTTVAKVQLVLMDVFPDYLSKEAQEIVQGWDAQERLKDAA